MTKITKDLDGNSVVLVPVEGTISDAVMFTDDYFSVVSANSLLPWSISEGPAPTRRVVDASGNPIANLIAKEKVGVNVIHLDSNLFNLRCGNLYTIHSGK